ncbi:MAG TPA: sigma-70 family RNA polymerase sigma factor [Streptosporangiaceae bacterium]|nr:sigma-70 family RNA polymerase sigma factor [Streptosporangiaceae bacterium]
MQHAGGTPEPVERFHTLYENCYQAIYAYVLRRTTAGHDDVPDIVAEVFVVAWRRRHVIPEPPAGRLWLYGVARRVLRNYERRVSRRQRLEARLREEASAAPADDLAYLSMREAVARLRPRYRETLRLVAWDGLSHTEAAAVLGCSVNAVAVTIHRAKAQLKKELSQTGPGPAVASVPSSASES